MARESAAQQTNEGALFHRTLAIVFFGSPHFLATKSYASREERRRHPVKNNGVGPGTD